MEKRMIVLVFWIFFSFIWAENPQKKILVLGFDGVDPELCQKWMDEGKLPHLKKLAEEGTFSSLGTSNPAQSPVSWCCFATGTNPGKTNIFDFLSRHEKDYRPKLGFVVEGERRLLPDAVWKRYAVVAGLGLLPLFLLLFRLAPKRFKKLRFISTISAIGLTLFLEIILLTIVLKIPPVIPSAKTNRHGDAFWQITTENKIKTTILKAPITFPTDPLNSYGKLLSGLGVPDLLQTNGLWSLYYSPLASLKENKIENTETGGRLIPIQLHGTTKDDQELVIYGPKNLIIQDQINRINQQLYGNKNLHWKESEVLSLEKNKLEKEIETRYRLPLSRKGTSVFIQGQEIQAKQWSPFFEVHFKMGIMTLNGIIRFYNAGEVHRPLVHINPWTGAKEQVGVTSTFEIYATPVQFHPEKLPGAPGMKPLVNISTPSDYAAQLKQEIGQFYDTLGWTSCTNVLKDEFIEESAFLEDLYHLYERQRELTENELKKDWQIFFSLFEETDRVCHMMWRCMDPNSPMYNAELANTTYESVGIGHTVSNKEWVKTYADSILDFYIKMDNFVGETYEKYVKNNPNVLFLVISDHGFQGFYRSVNINNWLRENGYLALKKESSHLKIADLFNKNLLKDVDWSKTKAYSIGLGKIYLNVEGRESQGIVVPSEVPALKLEIIQKLKQLQDAERNNAPVVQEVYDREKIYQGKFVQESADLILGFHKGYRVSWQSTLGGFGDNTLENNMMKWSGDHCSMDPEFVNGIIFSNKKIDHSGMPHIEHLAPTFLEYLGQTVPIHMDKKPLKFK